MSLRIPQMEPLITDADRAAVQRYLESGGWITEFDQTRALERSICETTGARYCVMTPSGTLALFLALAACDVARDDEVIVPDLTMAASATAVLLAGGQVVFSDIERETFCLDFACAERLISPRTKAVVLVSLNGRAPAATADFVARCRSRGIRVVEDAAQSLGSFYRGRHLGTVGDCGCFSFSSQKIVTTGQGGAVVTSDEDLYRRMLLLRDFGRRSGGSDHYETVGWNLKFTDLQAVLGVEQMRRLPALRQRKKEIYSLYADSLAGIRGLEMPRTDLDLVTPWFVDVLVAKSTKASLIDFLGQNGVGSREFYPPLHAERAFRGASSFPVAEEISSRGLWLPSSLKLENAEIEEICALVRRFYG